MSSAFIYCTGRPRRMLTLGVPTWTLDLMVYALPKPFLSFPSRDHGGGSGISRQISFRFRQLRVFWNPQDPPPRQFNEAAPDRQVILAVCEATSGAALSGVADLEAAPEVAQTKPL